jgi:hypothetical protein
MLRKKVDFKWRLADSKRRFLSRVNTLKGATGDELRGVGQSFAKPG